MILLCCKFISYIIFSFLSGDGGDIRLTVVDGDDKKAFLINPAGRLCLNTEVDRETQSLYNLTVRAHDCVQPVSAQLSSSTQVIVEIHDINDNAPLFVSSKVFNIPEDAALHSAVFSVHAEDRDTGSNGEVSYYLHNTSGGLFSMNRRSGEIYLEKELDREKVDTLTITVTTTDNGSPRMATTLDLIVHIEDVNDNDPQFSQISYSVTVKEDLRRGTSIFQLHAIDPDKGENGQVRYRLTQRSPFVVDSVRGVVTVMENLDREIQSNYNLIITAVDQGRVPRSSTAVVSITVLDVNDFVPQFNPETLTIHVKENEEDHAQRTHQVQQVTQPN